MRQKKTSPLPKFLRAYFWDVSFEELETQKNPRFILKRIIDRGNTKALLWAMSIFSLDDIRELVMTTRDISRKTANFWTLVLDIDPNRVPCLQKPYSRIPFGPSN